MSIYTSEADLIVDSPRTLPWLIDYNPLNILIIIMIVIMTIFVCIIIIVLFVVPKIYGFDYKKIKPDTSTTPPPPDEPTTKSCPKCFLELPPDAIYCSECGENV